MNPTRAEVARVMSAMGRRAAGIKKTITESERRRRREAMISLNAARAARKGAKP